MPAVRITQIPVETSIAPADARIRITQIPVETSIAPADAKIRITQIASETSISVIQVYTLSTWELDPYYHAITPFRNKGFIAEQDSFIPVFAAAPSTVQPVISIMT